jgi:hypothetical protein
LVLLTLSKMALRLFKTILKWLFRVRKNMWKIVNRRVCEGVCILDLSKDCSSDIKLFSNFIIFLKWWWNKGEKKKGYIFKFYVLFLLLKCVELVLSINVHSWHKYFQTITSKVKSHC